MPTPNAAAGCRRAGCWRRAPAAAAGSACCSRPDSTSSWRGWRPVRVGAIAVPISTFSTPIELRDLLRRADVDLLIGAPSYRGNDYVAGLHDALGRGLSASVPSPTVPFLRHVWLEEGFGTLEALAAAVPDAVLDAAEDDVTPDDRMVIVHTSGSTSAPKGVLHQHGSLLGAPREPEPVCAASTRHAATSRTRRCSGSAASPTTSSACSSPGATLLCSAPPIPADTLDFIERERPESDQRLRRVDRPLLVAHPSFATRDFSSIRAGNLHPLLPEAIRPADPELRHNMLGTTETGSVCLMDPDETDQPESRRGLVRPAGARPRRAGGRPRDPRRRARRGSWASSGSGARP